MDPRLLTGAVAEHLARPRLEDALRGVAEALVAAGAAGAAVQVELPGLTRSVEAGERGGEPRRVPLPGVTVGAVAVWGDGAPVWLDVVAVQVGQALDARGLAAVRSVRELGGAPSELGEAVLACLVDACGGGAGTLVLWSEADGRTRVRAQHGRGAVCGRWDDPTCPCPHRVDRGRWASHGPLRRERATPCQSMIADHALCLPLEPGGGVRGLAVLETDGDVAAAALLDVHHLAEALGPTLRAAESEGTAARVRVRCLGACQVSVDDNPVAPGSWRRRRALELLQRLCVGGRPLGRAALAEQWWPEATGAQRRNRLNGVVHALRTALDRAGSGSGAVVLSSRETLALDTGAVDVDVWALRAELARGAAATAWPEREVAHLRAAVALYSGELLPSCADAWCASEREDLRTATLEALRRLAELTDDDNARVDWLSRAVGLDPLREDLWRRLAEAQLALGRRHAALQTIQRCERALASALGARPAEPTRALHRRLLHVLGRPD